MDDRGTERRRTIDGTMSRTLKNRCGYCIRSYASTMTSNSSNNYIHNNKKIGKILYGNCLNPVTNSTDILTIVKQKQKDTDESNNEIVKTNNKINFFRKFKPKRTEIINSKTQKTISNAYNNINNNNNDYISKTEKI